MARSSRRFAVVSTVAMAIATITSLAATPARGLPQHPDIILIVTDDQHAGTLRWLPTVRGYMEARGVFFPNAAVPTPTCCPSRASILTGQFAHTTKVWSNARGWPNFVDAEMENNTVAVWLRRVGYRTALIGKYMNEFSGVAGPPPGWEVWHSFLGSNARYYDYDLLHTDGSTTHQGFGPAAYSTDVLRGYATRFIAATPSNRPFFLYFAPYAPHGPATPAPRHRTLPVSIARWSPPSLTEDLSDKPRWIRRLRSVNVDTVNANRIQEYRSLRSVDEAVDAVLDAQRARGRLWNTLVIVLSDNGVMWGEHRVLGKFVPYAGATRVPLAIAWPAHLEGARTDRRLALNLDVPATIADAADAWHAPIAGRSLLQPWLRAGFVLEAGRARVPGANGTNVERPAYCGWRTRRYLFVHYANGREELYDYRLDPWELRDRRGTRPELQTRLRGRARAVCQPVPPGFHW